LGFMVDHLVYILAWIWCEFVGELGSSRCYFWQFSRIDFLFYFKERGEWTVD